MSKDQIYGFLTELYETLVDTPSLRLPSDELYNECLNCLETNVVINWRERVDNATLDLASRWIQEEVQLETTLPKWAELYYEDQELSSILRKVRALVVSWKTELTAALYRDESLFSIPQEMQSPDKLVFTEASNENEGSDANDAHTLEFLAKNHTEEYLSR